MEITLYDEDRTYLLPRGIGYFKFNEQGKIQTEKEFFNLGYFLEQLQK